MKIPLDRQEISKTRTFTPETHLAAEQSRCGTTLVKEQTESEI
jgi:hypothetical protein